MNHEPLLISKTYVPDTCDFIIKIEPKPLQRIDVSKYIAKIGDTVRSHISNESSKLTDQTELNALIPQLKEIFPQISFINDPNEYSYIPYKINISNHEHVAFTIHELCHFIVATPNQRLLINYGLGSAPIDDPTLPECKVDDSIFDPHTEEFYAGLLSLIYHEYFGYDLWKIIEYVSLEDTFVNRDPSDDWSIVLNYLTDANIISWDEFCNPIPTFNINTGSLKFVSIYPHYYAKYHLEKI